MSLRRVLVPGLPQLPVSEKPEQVGRAVNLEIMPVLRALVDANNATRDELAALLALIGAGGAPSGAAGGQLGGTYPDPDVRGVRETSGPTELVLGAVADGEFLQRVGATVVGGTPSAPPPPGIDTVGSIFSMVGPLGAAAPVVAYDFTLYDSSLTVAQNLVNANQSGNASFDLVVAAGGARIAYQSAEVTAGFSASYGVAPVGGRVDGGILWSGRAQYVKGAAAGLVFVGAMTAEWLGYIPRPPVGGSGEVYLFGYGGGGGAEVNNTTWYLVWGAGSGPAGSWYYTHQTGIRVSVTQTLTYNPPADFPPAHGIPLHLVLTRSAAGSLQFYMQGRLARSAVTPFPALPTGGTSGSLEIGYGEANVDLSTLAVRLFDVELTPAQVRESYFRGMYGVGA